MAMSEDLATLKSELLELDRQLARAALHATDRSDAVAVQSALPATLKQALDDRLATLDGSTWQLLLLEWRYDFALLFDQIRLSMARIDAGFNIDPAWKA